MLLVGSLLNRKLVERMPARQRMDRQQPCEDLIPDRLRRSRCTREPYLKDTATFRCDLVDPAPDVAAAMVEASFDERPPFEILQRLVDLSEVQRPRRANFLLERRLD